jgi:uncharacterized membrane protein YeaQ/YmgE (transglycosylase-associated protein family)
MGFTEIISWIVFGLAAGAVAKLLMPGKDPGGFVGTIVIGIFGALVGGSAAKILAIGQAVKPGFDIKSFGFAVGGSILLLIVYRLVKGKG